MRRHAHPDARFVGSLAELPNALARTLHPGDVLLTLGAGDIGALAQELCPMAEALP